MKTLIQVTAGALMAAMAAGVVAQTFPTRPIRIVVPFPPGGASDIIARLLAEKYSAAWNVTAVVDNRPGGIGIIGTDTVAKATPDGHTLGVNSLSFAVAPSIRSNLPYDSQKDFAPITIIAANPLMLVVNNNVPAKSVKELIDLAKAKPDSLSYASSGTGSSLHLATELFILMTGVKIAHIAYKGSTQAHPDLIGGRVDLMFDTIVAIAPLVRSNRLRPLAVTSKKRSAEFPDLPTIAEAGVPGYEMTSWVTLLAPAKTPPAVIEKLNKETVRILGLPDARERLARLGSEPIGNTPAEARQYIAAEFEKWSKVVKAAGIKAEQ
jgi:tripartite-type tricarboxylate transporter receptor subunit TctC